MTSPVKEVTCKFVVMAYSIYNYIRPSSCFDVFFDRNSTSCVRQTCRCLHVDQYLTFDLLTTHINIDLFRTTKFSSLGVGYELIWLLVAIMARLTGSLRPQYTIVHSRLMPTSTIFMDGCLNE